MKAQTRCVVVLRWRRAQQFRQAARTGEVDRKVAVPVVGRHDVEAIQDGRVALVRVVDVALGAHADPHLTRRLGRVFDAAHLRQVEDHGLRRGRRRPARTPPSRARCRRRRQSQSGRTSAWSAPAAVARASGPVRHAAAAAACRRGRRRARSRQQRCHPAHQSRQSLAQRHLGRPAQFALRAHCRCCVRPRRAVPVWPVHAAAAHAGQVFQHVDQAVDADALLAAEVERTAPRPCIRRTIPSMASST